MKLTAIILGILCILPCLGEVLEYDNIYLEYQGEDGRIAAELGKRLAKEIGDFQKKTGHYPELETHIIIAANREEYKTFLQKGVEIQEFSQAFYKRSTNTIYIRNPHDNLRYDTLSKILLHEYIHSFVYHYFINAPLWFHEGMAVYFSNDFSHNRELGLARDYLFGNTLPLSQMRKSYPENRIEWESFYAKSALAVRYLFQNKPGQFYQLWQVARPSSKFNAAFLKSFKYTPLDFSIYFEEYCETHFRSEIILALSGMIWLLFPFLFIIGYFRRRQKAKKQLAAMEKEDEEESEFGEVYANKLFENGVDVEE